MKLVYRLALLIMQAKYPLKIQAIRSKNQQARLYVYFPLPLAAAIGLEAGEEVQWELLDRGELHLVRKQVPQVQASQRRTQGAEIPSPSPKQTATGQRRPAADGSSS
jgi:hypothetical protein